MGGKNKMWESCTPRLESYALKIALEVEYGPQAESS